MNELKYTTLDDNYELRKSFNDDAGYDLISAWHCEIEPGQTALIPTPFHIAIPSGYVGLIKDRSNMAMKQVYTHAGVIDAGYKGVVKVLLENHNRVTLWQRFRMYLNKPIKWERKQMIIIEPGDRIAQLIVLPIYNGQCTKVKLLLPTKRGDGGFGSTGK